MTTLSLAWDLTPADVEDGGLLVLLPSLGTTTDLWEGTVAELRASRVAARILRLDLPGHGASPTATGPFSISDLADATLHTIDELGGGQFWVAGDSLGGCVGLELAVRAPERVRGLAMFCSGSRIGSRQMWEDRAARVRRDGTRSLLEATPSRWFAAGFLEGDRGDLGQRALEQLERVDDGSYAFCAEALSTFDRTGDLSGIRMPVMVVAGSEDTVTPPVDMADLAAAIPLAEYTELAGTAHLAPLESPAETAAVIRTMLESARV